MQESGHAPVVTIRKEAELSPKKENLLFRPVVIQSFPANRRFDPSILAQNVSEHAKKDRNLDNRGKYIPPKRP
jgi:hypothetical protein